MELQKLDFQSFIRDFLVIYFNSLPITFSWLFQLIVIEFYLLTDFHWLASMLLNQYADVFILIQVIIQFLFKLVDLLYNLSTYPLPTAEVHAIAQGPLVGNHFRKLH